MAGKYRGRRLKLPKARLRPTADRVKEAWFSILGERVRGAAVADMFAGSGALGIEALSRGAARVDFYERSRAAVDVLQSNLEMLSLDNEVRVYRGNAITAAAGLARWAYDVVLADPPYGEGYATALVAQYRDRPFARVLTVEHGKGELTGADDCRRYGDTEISFYYADD